MKCKNSNDMAIASSAVNIQFRVSYKIKFFFLKKSVGFYNSYKSAYIIRCN